MLGGFPQNEWYVSTRTAHERRTDAGVSMAWALFTAVCLPGGCVAGLVADGAWRYAGWALFGLACLAFMLTFVVGVPYDGSWRRQFWRGPITYH